MKNFEVKNGKIIMREAAMLRYASQKPNAAPAEQEPAPLPNAKPLTMLKTLVGKIMRGDLKVDDQVIAKVTETLNKAQQIAKDHNKELLKHIVDGLSSGEYKCDDKVLQTAAESLNKAQQLDKFADEEE